MRRKSSSEKTVNGTMRESFASAEDHTCRKNLR